MLLSKVNPLVLSMLSKMTKTQILVDLDRSKVSNTSLKVIPQYTQLLISEDQNLLPIMELKLILLSLNKMILVKTESMVMFTTS